MPVILNNILLFIGLTCFRILITKCLNLKIVELGRTVSLTDNTISEVLAYNPLKSLEVFSIKGSESSGLSILSAETILASCPCLTSLTDLRCWVGVFPREVQDLEERALRMNWNIDFGTDTENISEDALRRAGLKEKFDRLREQFGDMVMIP